MYKSKIYGTGLAIHSKIRYKFKQTFADTRCVNAKKSASHLDLMLTNTMRSTEDSTDEAHLFKSLSLDCLQRGLDKDLRLF